MKIFITGIAGFLGSHLAKRLEKLGHEISGNDSLIGGELSNLDNKKIKFYDVDCCDLDRMTEITKNIDIIYHCAATAHEGLSVFSPHIIIDLDLYAFDNRSKKYKLIYLLLCFLIFLIKSHKYTIEYLLKKKAKSKLIYF